MKTLYHHSDKNIKISLDMTGGLMVTLPGGENYKGDLSPEELQQLAFRLSVVSEGKLSFDPEPSDLLALHHIDVETLERQAIALDENRAELTSVNEILQISEKEKLELQERLSTCESELTEARGALKDERTAVSLLNEKLEIAELVMAKSTVTVEPTVHNERDTEPPLSQESEPTTVHNERENQVEEMPI